MDALAALLKTLLYASILLSTGAVIASATFREFPKLDELALRTTRWSAIASILITLSAAVVLILRLGGFDSATVAAVFSSSSGAAIFIQLTGATLLLASGEDESARVIRLVASALGPLSLAFNGHAAAQGPFEALFLFAHVLAVAWWIGSLWLLNYACSNLSQLNLGSLVQRFGAIATQIVGALVIAGLLLIFVLVGFENLPSLSVYEQLLAVKLLIVAALLGLAAYNKFRLTPRLQNNDRQAAITLKKCIQIELAIIAAIFAFTAAWTTYTSPH